MKKILFLIHDLGQGGAEKVLVNLVNNMDKAVFDITVMAMFGGGVNEPFLKPHVRLINVFPREFPANSKLMKLLTPKQLHKWCIKDKYDIEVSYLEGPSARVIAGGSLTWNGKAAVPRVSDKYICWIHGEQHTPKIAAASFRSFKEAKAVYNAFDKVVCVSQTVAADMQQIFDLESKPTVLYNTVESQKILEQASQSVSGLDDDDCVKLIAVGTLKEVKGFDRLLRVTKRLHDAGCPVHLYILGKGPLQAALESQIAADGMADYATLLGYHTNPYAYVAKSDVFVCSSHSEGFSTAATEALIVGTPVCTVEVSGMKEMLGEHNEYGVVTDNNEDALYEGLHHLLTTEGVLTHYKQQAAARGKQFSTEETVQAVERMLLSL